MICIFLLLNILERTKETQRRLIDSEVTTARAGIIGKLYKIHMVAFVLF